MNRSSLLLALVLIVFLAIGCGGGGGTSGDDPGGGSNDGPSTPSRNDAPEVGVDIQPDGGITTSTTITISLTVTDSQGDEVEARVDFDGDGTWDAPYSTTMEYSHVYPAEGTYPLKVQARDDQGAESAVLATYILVADPDPTNSAPTITGAVSPSSGYGGITSFSYVLYPSDEDGDATTVRIDYEGDGTWDTPFGPQTTYSKIFGTPGTYTGKIQARDSHGAESEVQALSAVTVNVPPPDIGEGVSPSHADAGASGFTLTVSGSGFVSGSVVRWNGSTRSTTYVSAAQLRAFIPAYLLAAAGTCSVTVRNPNGDTSDAAVFTVLPSRTSVGGHSVTAWPENRKGAVSLTFDDGLPSQFNLGLPALDARGMKASFYILTSYDNAPLVEARWNAWRGAAAGGHEIGSHTISHQMLGSLPYEEMVHEVVDSKHQIDDNVTTRQVRTFVYPAGNFNDDTVSVVQNNYIAARGVNCSLNAEPYDFYNVYGCTPDDTAIDLAAWTAAAEAQGKWLVPYFHSLAGGDENGWGSYEIGDFTAYLDFLATRDVWVGTFESAVKYLREKATANLALLSSAPSEIVLQLTDSMNDAVYDQPMTLRSVIPGWWPRGSVQQGGGFALTVNPVTEGPDRVIYYDAVPDGGPIVLTPSY